MRLQQDDEEEQLRAVALQNARSILVARQRAEDELVAAKEALEARSAELERANALVRTIAENAASCLLMLDENGIATYMNPAAVDETGYSLEEFSRARFHDVLHAPAADDAHTIDACPIKNAREQMQLLKNFRDAFMRKDGSTFPVSCSLSPLQRDGRPAGAVLEFRDITDDLRAQKTLEDANRRKDEFLATLSHELRTPMTAVLGWARMLKLGLPESEVPDALDAIEKNAVIQAQLIDDVLDVSRIVAGKMTFTPSAIEVGPVLHAAMTTVHPAATAKGIEILSSIPPVTPRVLGDEGRLQQIFWNVLSNAVKFTPQGGVITLRLAHVGSKLRLTVHDTGKGIDPRYLPHVFEPFSQQDGSTTRSHEGIGLGLSIVRSLVELHGGTIRVSSDGLGKGATFTIQLPVIHESRAVAEQAARVRSLIQPDRAKELPPMHGLRVLVIDDQEFTRDVLSAIFRRAGVDVHLAASVREGLQQFDAASPHIVVCDLAMPGDDGYAFLRALRNRSGTASRTPVIALTAFGRPEDRQYALAAGFNAYLKKPVDPEELASTVLHLAN